MNKEELAFKILFIWLLIIGIAGMPMMGVALIRESYWAIVWALDLIIIAPIGIVFLINWDEIPYWSCVKRWND